MYDCDGREAFVAQWPKLPKTSASSAPDPEPCEHYRVLYEYINVDIAKQAMELLDMRTLVYCGYSYAQILQFFIDRSSLTHDCRRSITVIVRDNARAKRLGLRGRLVQGVLGLPTIPDELKLDHEVPIGFVGVGAFSLPRILRNCLRTGLGHDQVRDYDQANAFFEFVGEKLTEWGLISEFPTVQYNIKERKKFMAEIGAEDAKQQTLAVGFQCAKTDRMAPVLQKLHDEMGEFYHIISVKLPTLVYKVTSLGKRRPLVTTCAYLFLDRERKVTDMLLAAAGNPDYVSVEADGIVLMQKAAELQSLIEQASPSPIVEKPYPRDFKEWLAFSKIERPNLEWKAKSRFPWAEYQRSLTMCNHALQCSHDNKNKKVDIDSRPPPGPLGTPLPAEDVFLDIKMSIHTDFAAVVAVTLESTVLVVGSDVHYFDDVDRLWKKPPRMCFQRLSESASIGSLGTSISIRKTV
jgi:hypothetical protein